MITAKGNSLDWKSKIISWEMISVLIDLMGCANRCCATNYALNKFTECVAFCDVLLFVWTYVRITTYRNFKYKHDLTYALNMYDKYFKSVYKLR